MNKPGIVYYVHCVDTEGPLTESLNATFEIVEKVCGVRLEPTSENLEKLKAKAINLQGKEDVVYDYVSMDKLDYIESMEDLSSMLDIVMNDEFRNSHLDSFGNPYVFNWFCLDHVGFTNNPRNRLLGFHKIFEFYLSKIIEHDSNMDRVYWHYHPRAFSLQAHRFGMNYSFSNMHNEILARRIIDHIWFPTVNRPGAHMERADMNLWLESWIPFDLANQNMQDNTKLEMHEKSYRLPGRMGDWRNAPVDWRIYHPSFFDTRKEGGLKRYIARCLNINARQGQINEQEIERAFSQAMKGEDVLFSVTNHDFRNFQKETEGMIHLFSKVAAKYHQIEYRCVNAVEAFRAVLKLPETDPVKFRFVMNDAFFKIYSDKPVWGVQPFLALKTKDGRYFHDNLIVDSETSWTYPLDQHSMLPEDLSCIGFAANDEAGNTTVNVYKDLDDSPQPIVKTYNNKDWIK